MFLEEEFNLYFFSLLDLSKKFFFINSVMILYYKNLEVDFHFFNLNLFFYIFQILIKLLYICNIIFN